MTCHPVLLPLNPRIVQGELSDVVAEDRRHSRGRDLIPIAVAAVTDRCGFIQEEHAAFREVSVERRVTAGGIAAVLRMTCDGGHEVVGTLEVTALLVDDTERVVRIDRARLSAGEQMVWVLKAPRGWGWGDVWMVWIAVVVG